MHFRSWWLITYWGRRQIYVTGMGVLCTILFIVGILDVSIGKRGLWASGGLCVFWLFTYALTVGPITVSICVTESLAALFKNQV